MMTKNAVLCIAKNIDNLDLLKFLFRDSGYHTLGCHSIKVSLKHLKSLNFSAVVIDDQPSDDQNFKLLKSMKTSSFGAVTATDSTLYRERQIQFAARF